MTIKKLMMAAGAIDGPQVIAPSSNDWDYTFAQNEWPAAGNTLGDHTIGGYIDNTGGDSGTSSLITFDGDFEIEWTATGASNHLFGVHAIDEDDTRTTDNRVGMKSMTNSFFWESGGTSPKDFFIGSSAQSDTNTFAAGSVIKIERVSGTIKVYDDGVVVHTYGTTYTGTMRFSIGAPGSPFNLNYDNILFTDTEKVQRDGFYNEGTSPISDLGDFQANSEHYARRITATRTGTVGTVLLNIAAVHTAFDSVCQIYSDDGTSPASIIGSASDTINLSSTGDKTYTFASLPEVVKGTTYWVVFSDTTMDGTGRVTPGGLTQSGLPENQRGCGRNAPITSITDSEVTPTLKMEMRINATGEPTPDHDTLLLIHSDTSDGSTTFADSSQFGRTITVNGDTQHDTAQTLGFNASAMLFDGTGDYLAVAHHADFNLGTGDFTIECRVRRTAAAFHSLIGKAASGGTLWSQIVFQLAIEASGQIKFWFSNNGGAGFILAASSNISLNTNYHIAVVRMSNNFNLYLDGVSVASTTSTNSMLVNSAPITIGDVDEAAAASLHQGWLDEVRISRVARWDANFTSPTSAYP